MTSTSKIPKFKGPFGELKTISQNNFVWKLDEGFKSLEIKSKNADTFAIDIHSDIFFINGNKSCRLQYGKPGHRSGILSLSQKKENKDKSLDVEITVYYKYNKEQKYVMMDIQPVEKTTSDYVNFCLVNCLRLKHLKEINLKILNNQDITKENSQANATATGQRKRPKKGEEKSTSKSVKKKKEGIKVEKHQESKGTSSSNTKKIDVTITMENPDEVTIKARSK